MKWEASDAAQPSAQHVVGSHAEREAISKRTKQALVVWRGGEWKSAIWRADQGGLVRLFMADDLSRPPR